MEPSRQVTHVLSHDSDGRHWGISALRSRYKDSELSGAAASVDPPKNDYVLNSDFASPIPENRFGWDGRGSVPDDNGQRALFSAHHTPPELVTLASAGRSPRDVGAVIGAAALESKARYGEFPKPSGDLSRFSAPLVEHLANKGLIEAPKQDHGTSRGKPGSKVKVTNDLDRFWGDMNVRSLHHQVMNATWPGTSARSYDPKIVRSDSANVGQQFMENALRPRKEKPVDPGVQEAMF